MRLLNDEMRDMLMMSRDTKTAIREMNEAFTGEQESDYIHYKDSKSKKSKVKKVVRQKTVERPHGTAQNKALEPIMESEEVDNTFALVPVNNGRLKKKRNDILKQRAKLITGELGKNPYLSFGREDTFVTGGGLPGRNRRTANVEAEQEEDEEEKEYDCLEDQLLAEVDKHEKDFNQMFVYLNECEDMLHGNDVAQIRELMKVTDKRTHGHIVNYDKIRAEMTELADDAVEAMKSLGKFDKNALKVAKEAER